MEMLQPRERRVLSLARQLQPRTCVSNTAALAGKVCIVTGGAGGIGHAIAKAFSSAGAVVVVASRNKDNLDAVVAELGGSAAAVVTDVTVPDDVEKLVSRTVALFGRLDVMVCNSGGALRMGKPEKETYEHWRAVTALNLDSVFLCCTAAARQMIKQGGGGRIVNVSSMAGSHGQATMIGYGAAKAAVNNLSSGLADAWARHGICVNAVAPGLTATPVLKKMGWIPEGKVDKQGRAVSELQRAPSPEEVAQLVLFLAGPGAGTVTGQVMPIEADGRMVR